MSKEDLLAAIAQAGTRGAEAYQTAQKGLMAQQSSAVADALRTAAGAPPEAQARVQQIVQSGYAPRQAQLTSDQATMSDYYGRLGTNAGLYADQTAQLIPAIERQNQLAREAAAASRGRGGGGGSSSNDFLDLRKQFGTDANLKDYITGQAKLSGDPYSARAIAAQLGVPDQIAAAWFQYGSANEEYQTRAQQGLQKALAAGVSKAGLQSVRTNAKALARELPGNQSKLRKQFVSRYKKQLKRG